MIPQTCRTAAAEFTGNFMGFFDGFDHYIISRPLTFASWDSSVGLRRVDPRI